MQNSLFKPSDIANFLEKEYKLEIGYDEGSRKERMETLKKKIKDVSKEISVEIKDSKGNSVITNLYEVSKRGENSRNDHLFTYDEVQRILMSEELYEYVQRLLMPPEYKEKFKEHKKLAEAWNAAYREDFFSPQGIPALSNITIEDLEKKRLQIMIEALFLRYFTPVDMDHLRKDMELVSTYSGTDEYIPQVVAAHERLMDNRSYYEERKPAEGKDPKKKN